MSEVAAALVYCPFPDRESARDIAAKLLDEKLIACANILPEIESVFEWRGKISRETEASALFKTTATQLEALIARLGELHPYDTPAIVGWCCDGAHGATLEWLWETVRTP